MQPQGKPPKAETSGKDGDAAARTPDGQQDALSTTSRRQWQRRPFHQAVEVCELDESGAPSAEWACRAVDISRGGIGLRSRRMVHVGRRLFIRIKGAAGAQPKLLFGVVKQSRYQEGEGFVIGVKFEEIPQTWAITKWLTGGQ